MTTSRTHHGARDDLLGVVGRDLASPPGRGWVMTDSRAASVLILFGVLDAIPATTPEAAVARDLDVLLQRRSPTLSSHPGQISFPGGGQEPEDADVVATALREAEEETGLDPSGVEVLGTIGTVPAPVSNHLVTPVLGWWRTPSRVAAVDHAETVEVFRVPVAHLLDPAHRFTSVHRRGGQRFRMPAFDLDGIGVGAGLPARDRPVVWGFTAILLSGLFDLAGWTVPWDPGIEREV